MSHRPISARPAASLALALALALAGGGVVVAQDGGDGASPSREGRRHRTVGEAMAAARSAADRALRTICVGCGGTGEFRRNRDLPDSSTLVAVPTLPVAPRSRVAAVPRPAELPVRSRVSVRLLPPQAPAELRGEAATGEVDGVEAAAQPTTRLVRRVVSRRVCRERPSGRMACRVVRRTRLVRIEIPVPSALASQPAADAAPPVSTAPEPNPGATARGVEEPIAPVVEPAAPPVPVPAAPPPRRIEAPVVSAGAKPVPVPPPAPTRRVPGTIQR